MIGAGVVHAVAAAASHGVEHVIAFAELNGWEEGGFSQVGGCVGNEFVNFIAFDVVVDQVETVGLSLGDGKCCGCYGGAEKEEGFCELHFEVE